MFIYIYQNTKNQKQRGFFLARNGSLLLMKQILLHKEIESVYPQPSNMVVLGLTQTVKRTPWITV